MRHGAPHAISLNPAGSGSWFWCRFRGCWNARGRGSPGPASTAFHRAARIGWVWLRALTRLLRGLAIGGLAVALARPQTVGGVTRIAGQGVAIVVALDNSSSMNAVDFPADHGTRRISRLEAAKATFISLRRGPRRRPDRPGRLRQLSRSGMSRRSSITPFCSNTSPRCARRGRATTARTSVTRSPWGSRRCWIRTPKKKVLVLLTDGNNEPAVPHPLDPEKAAILARDLGVTMHTIAIGRLGGIPRTASIRSAGCRPWPTVRARIFRCWRDWPSSPAAAPSSATDADALAEVFRTIDALEKSPVRGQILTRYDEHYALWAGLALAMSGARPAAFPGPAAATALTERSATTGSRPNVTFTCGFAHHQ